MLKQTLRLIFLCAQEAAAAVAECAGAAMWAWSRSNYYKEVTLAVDLEHVQKKQTERKIRDNEKFEQQCRVLYIAYVYTYIHTYITYIYICICMYIRVYM